MKIKTIVVAVLFFTSAALFAQVRPGPGPGRRPGPEGLPPRGGQPAGELSRPQPLDGVKAALNLTDTQVEAVRALMGVRMESEKPLFENIAEKRRAYQEISSQANPDATALGNALTALRDAEATLGAAHEKFKLDFEALLTPAQLATLNSVREAAPKIQALAAIGLVGDGPQGFGPGPGFGRGQRGPGR